MSKIKPQLARLMYIDREIRSNRYPNCTTIAEEYEVSTRTIQRDIEYMKDMLQAPIEYDALHRGFFYDEENYMLPSVDIKESDFFALCVAEKALEQYKNTPLYDKLSAVFEKLLTFLPDEIRINTSWIDSEFTFLEESRTIIKPAIWETLLSSLRNKNAISITYKTPGKSMSKREVNIYHMVNHGGEWYILAHCSIKKTVLIFAVSRIETAAQLSRQYEIPADFNFTEHMGNHFGIMVDSKNFKTTIRFSKEQAPYVKERIWHKTQKIKERRDGTIDLTFTTNSRFEVKRWILSWGSHARVIKPEALAADIALEFKKSLKNYS